MKIIDPEALATPRSVCCEYCGLYCRRATERHHIVARRMGGGCRLDIPENLIDLGGPFDCGCHYRLGGRKKYEDELFSRVALRLGRTAEDVRGAVYAALNAPKGS